MDIQEQIDQFLQIPEIKEIFSDHDIHWHVGEYSQGWYFDFSVPDYEKGFFLGAWNAWQAVKAQAVPEGFVLVPKEPSADLVNHGHQVFLGHFNEGGQTGGRSLYFAYKAMIEAQENNG